MPDELTPTPPVEEPVETPPEDTPEEPEGGEQEVIDPGQLEGLPKAAQTDTPNVQKRIDKLTAKFRAEERRAQDNEKKLAELQEQYRRDIDLLRQHNQQVIEAVKANQPRQAQQDEVAALSSQVKDLKAQKAKALKEMDLDTVTDLEEQIDTLKDRLYEVKLARVKQTTESEVSQKVTQNQQRAVAEQFASQTGWFRRPLADSPNPDYNPLMAGAAVEYEIYLTSQPEWKGRPYSDVLAEVKRHVEDQFGYGKPKPKPPTVTGVGAPIGRVPVEPKLSEDERRVARMIFSDLSAKDAEKKYYDQKTGRV